MAQATAQGTAASACNIRSGAERSGEEAVITIRDHGIGIAPEMQHEIFELFSQGERTLDRAQGGLGIGLALVRQLVELHGGSVIATSEGTGQGSVFTIRLPVRTAEDVAGSGTDGLGTGPPALSRQEASLP